ncbi:methionyl-tRNA formyltransferase [Haloferax namakaokahaiae]|uniref:Methionyl-tRNA formyltransferase n=1 Tax=Haloferax namakaokahaiae TaxID=1748331 RepID=A0ABD5ZEE3_9EURY
MDVLFLGTNNMGTEIYEWLCDRDSVTVQAMITTKGQLELVERLQPDIAVAVGYRHIVPESILDIPEQGFINVHPGYLPAGRGFNPNVWSIVEGHPAGVTIHQMDPGIDTGALLARREVETRFDDNGKDVYERLESAAVELFVETWPDIQSGTIEPVPQKDTNAPTHKKSEFADLCKLDAEEEYTVKELLDVLRALTFPPFNNATLEVDGENYFVEVSITHEDEASSDASSGVISSYGDE